eukprot:33145_3
METRWTQRWELIDASALAAEIEDADLGIRDTAAEAGLGVGLVFAVAVAASGTATHGRYFRLVLGNL